MTLLAQRAAAARCAGRRALRRDEHFGANGFDDFSPGGFNLGAVAVAEIILTALDALEQLWAFIVFPLLGGALGAFVAKTVIGAPKPAL